MKMSKAAVEKLVSENPLCSVKQTAAATNLSEKQIYKAIREGKIPVFSLGAGKFQVHSSWIAKNLGLDHAQN